MSVNDGAAAQTFSPPEGPHYTSVPLQVYMERVVADLHRFVEAQHDDQELRLQQRFDAQEKGVSTAITSAEKAVGAALTAAEKAVDKAERAQELRNEVANEFRSTIADTTGNMWSAKEGQAAVQAVDAKMAEAMASMRRERSALFEGIDARLKVLEQIVATSAGRDSGMMQATGDRRAGGVDSRGQIGMYVALAGLALVLAKELFLK